MSTTAQRGDDGIVRLNNDDEGQNLLRETVLNHYQKLGREINLFLMSNENAWHYEHFLLDRNHVFRCGIGEDRKMMLSSIELGIGPHYFGPSDFWNYQNSERFSMEASTEAVERNLNLLDEFLGYRPSEQNS